jgi:hypothetical protein
MPADRLPAAQREWLKPSEVASEFPFSEIHLSQLRHHGTGPLFFRRGRTVLYRRSDVESWLEAHMTTGGPLRRAVNE